MFLLDSDTLTLVHANHPRVAERQQTVHPSEIATTVVTKIEILRGRFERVLKAEDSERLLQAQRLLDVTEKRLQEMVVIPVEAAAATEFDKLLRNKKLKKIGRADLLIAGIAPARRATLVTRNLRHFRQVPGLRLENWAD